MKKPGKREWLRRNVGTFLRQYQRKAQRGVEPNDRNYDRKVEEELLRMRPEELSLLINEEDTDDSGLVRDVSPARTSTALASIVVSGWAMRTVGSTGWGDHATNELSRRLRKAINGTPAAHREVMDRIRTQDTLSLLDLPQKNVEGIRQLLLELGADLTVSICDAPPQ
jgi:hypothetical protein